MSTELPKKILEERIKDFDKDKALLESLDKIVLLSESGALDTVIDLMLTLKNISSVITDDMVDNIAIIARDLMNILGSIVGNPVIKVLSDSINDPAVDKAILNVKSGKVSLPNIISLMRDPDVIAGLYVFLVIMKSMGNNFRKYVENLESK